MKALHAIAFILVIVGALNWLVFGLSGWSVGNLFGEDMNNMVAKVIYVLVGLSGVYLILNHKKDCLMCRGDNGNSGMGMK